MPALPPARPRWIIFDEVLEGLEPESTLMALLATLSNSTMIYIGRSETYLETFNPRELHLHPLAAQIEQSASPAAGTGTAHAPAPVI